LPLGPPPRAPWSGKQPSAGPLENAELATSFRQESIELPALATSKDAYRDERDRRPEPLTVRKSNFTGARESYNRIIIPHFAGFRTFLDRSTRAREGNWPGQFCWGLF
jgi:hypothetical protein